jgi:[protein-PII] uridylyltransferase
MALKSGQKSYPELEQEITEARARLVQANLSQPGRQTCQDYSRAIFNSLQKHAEALCSEMPECEAIRANLLICAVGGFGRLEVNLHSDIDLLFVLQQAPTPAEEAFLKEFLYPLWNIKLQPSYMIKEVGALDEDIQNDLDLATTLMSTQAVWGDKKQLQKFQEMLRRLLTLKHHNLLTERILRVVQERHRTQGGTYSLLEPNLKESMGGLRDIHCIYWLSYLDGGTSDFSKLLAKGILRDRDAHALDHCLNFFLRLRNELHKQAGRHDDKLSVEHQIKLSRTYEYCKSENCLPEELLMRDYYKHAEIISKILTRVSKYARYRKEDDTHLRYTKIRGNRIEGHFWMRDGEIWLDADEAPKVIRDSAWMLHLFIACVHYNLTPTDVTLEQVTQCCVSIDDTFRHSVINRERFLTILRNTQQSGRILRCMHECHFLEALVPDFGKLRHLPRIDYYHKYTVDEHLLRAVEKCNALFQENSALYNTHVAKIARDILRPDLLNFAILMHDVGKGEGRKHVIRGAHMIQAFAAKLQLNDVESRVLHDLVANHHQISTVTLMRNADDPRVPQQLARDFKSPEFFKMLYVLTCCDMMAVSDDSWNEWKATLLAQMYERTMNHLIPFRDFRPTEEMIYVDIPELMSDSQVELIPTVEGSAPLPKTQKVQTIKEFLGNMPERYRQSTPPEYMKRHLRLLEHVSSERPVVVELELVEDSNYSMLHCATKSIPTVFCNLCGAIMSKNLIVISAQVYTAKTGVCIYIFQIQDRMGKPPVSPDVFERLEQKLIQLIHDKSDPNWQLPKSIRPMAVSEERLSMRPPIVTLSNDDSSEVYSILEIRAHDRPGLLFEITSMLEKHRVHVHMALIATESYQVIDVFYVTDWDFQRLMPSPATNMLCKNLQELVGLSPEMGDTDQREMNSEG